MRQFLLGLSISVAFIAGSLSAQLAPKIVPAARAAGETGRWLYRCDVIKIADTTHPVTNTDVTEHISALGKQGWELVLQYQPIWQGNSSTPVFCFKQSLH